MPALPTVTREHPLRPRWLEDERRMRASYLATRRHLAPFLVPHRFEGDDNTKDPTTLRRAKYGYGIRLNAAYLAEIHGHLRSAPATYYWGPLAPADAVDGVTGAPSQEGVALAVWRDATRDGITWKNFFEGTVLEWLTSSLGGFVVVDVPPVETLTVADERAADKRPFVRFVPWSAVRDLGIGATGVRWIVLEETVDTREPDSPDGDAQESRYVLYRLTDTGATVGRYDTNGDQIGETVELGALVDPHGRRTLPLVPVRLGAHPDLAWLGSGLLAGLDDIVIDLFNLVSETREGFRDAAFGLLVHAGADGDKVRDQLAQGSRFVTLGDGEKASLDRRAAEAAEVAAGLSLIELGVKNWALGAKRQAAEAMDGASQAGRSGVSLSAEFQLDLRPLLVHVAETLDQIESAVIALVAQMAGHEVGPDEVGVERATEFRLEEESSRIARIVTEFIGTELPFPAVAKERIARKWMDATELVDMDATAEGEAGTVGEVFDRQAAEIAAAEQEGALNSAAFGTGVNLMDPKNDPNQPFPKVGGDVNKEAA